jgi:SAM-dependent methyltransferase
MPMAYCLGRLEGVPLRSGAADVVLALDVLEHVADDVAGLREAARIVKPGGLLLVTVPALPSLWGGQDVVSHHLRRYTPRAFRQMFEHARIPNPRITYFNTLLFPSVAAVRWARRAAGLASRPRSDFDDSRPGMVNDVLAAIFGAERHLIARLRLPIGVSLLAIVHLPR